MNSIGTKITNTWYLENSITGKKVQITEQRSVHDILDSFLPDERKDWFLTFGSVEETIIESAETSRSQVAELTFPDGTSQIFFDDSPSERRMAPRVELNLKVTLISGNRIFRTTTTNVSVGGMLLSVKPPRDYSHPELKVLVEKKDGTKSLLLNVSFIPDSSQQRLKFEGVTAAEQAELQDWVECEMEPTLEIEELKLSA